MLSKNRDGFGLIAALNYMKLKYLSSPFKFAYIIMLIDSAMTSTNDAEH